MRFGSIRNVLDNEAIHYTWCAHNVIALFTLSCRRPLIISFPPNLI
jgi:hypothetical protein